MKSHSEYVDEVASIEPNKESVICLNTKEVFESCKAAYAWLGYHTGGHSIQDNCKGITKSAGRDPNTK